MRVVDTQFRKRKFVEGVRGISDVSWCVNEQFWQWNVLIGLLRGGGDKELSLEIEADKEIEIGKPFLSF